MSLSFSKILKYPRVYTFAQRILGGVQGRAWALESLQLRSGETLLDVGCGPAYYFGDLPPCRYFGFDTDADYIVHAQARFGGRGRFFAEPYTEAHRTTLPKFDAVMLMGLLHHLSDDEADGLLGLIARSLEPGGRVVALDTVFYEGQSRHSRWLAENDRGEFVRRPEGFRALASKHFGEIDGRVVGDTLTVVSSLYLMMLTRPLAPAATPSGSAGETG